jgi:3-hydroxyisobutyrate dehydrogenase-like beta-hydroxyacid dehydrogenase
MSTGEIGFVGLGRMGFPMARNLAGAGYRVHAYDVAPPAMQRAADVPGVVAHPAPRDVAAASAVVFTALPNDAIVRETYLGLAGLLAGARPGLVTCDCSTVSPGATREIHDAARGRGVHHLDTPMLGSAPQAESGEIFFMVGGDPAQLPVVRPLLEVMGRLVMHVGPSGTGNRIKLLHNALGAVNAVAVAESLALCDAVGVDPRTYYEVVKHGGGMAYSTYFDRRVLRLVQGDYSPTFTVELMQKDVALAADMAGEILGRLPILHETLRAYTEATASGFAPEDFSAVTHVVEGRLGRRLFAR